MHKQTATRRKQQIKRRADNRQQMRINSNIGIHSKIVGRHTGDKNFNKNLLQKNKNKLKQKLENSFAIQTTFKYFVDALILINIS